MQVPLDFVYRQNDVGKEMYFLVHGMVEVLGENDSMHDRFALLEEVSWP